MTTTTFEHYQEYIKLETPIDFGKFEAVGWFPYERAQISNTNVCVPSSVFSEIRSILYNNGINDNKFVVIFKDKKRFGTEDFAIMWKDSYCKMGGLQSVVGYALRTLLLK